jgi:hypothetical protein
MLLNVMRSPALPSELRFQLCGVQLQLLGLIGRVHGYAPLKRGPKRIDPRHSNDLKGLKRQHRRRDS